MLSSGDLSIGTAPYVQEHIAAIKAQASGDNPAGRGRAHGGGHGGQAGEEPAGTQDATLEALRNLERQMEEVTNRLSKIELELKSSQK